MHEATIASSNVARQRCQRRNPLALVARLPCAEVDSQCPELCGARRLWRARVNVAAPGDLEIDKPGRNDRCLELCIQQSTGDSAFPEIDVLFAFLGHRFLHQDVADLKATARLEHPRHLAQSPKLVGKKVQHTIRDDDIGPVVFHRQ